MIFFILAFFILCRSVFLQNAASLIIFTVLAAGFYGVITGSN